MKSKGELKTRGLASVAASALCAVWMAPVHAGTFDDAPVIDVTGDGFIFSDPEEGVLPPGLMGVTTTPNIDYPNTMNPSGIQNCLMANNPGLDCEAEPGSGKRIKTRLTGPGGMDIRLSTQASGGVTDYYVYGKTSNLTGARITGFRVELGTGTGADFVAMNTSDPDTAALFDEGYISRFNLPDGLFGSGGQEDAGIGFYDDARAQMSVNVGESLLAADTLANATYAALFGDAMLDDGMIPDGYFWDATGTAITSDEPVLVAWYNTGAGAWTYGNLGVAAPTDPEVLPLADRLDALADSLGVDVADLGYTDAGDVIPDDILAAMQGSSLFEVDVIEDIRNLNLNFILELGDLAGEELTLRLTPLFPQIVSEAQSAYQFDMAAHLDMAANVPYLDLGNQSVYQAAIGDILALAPAAQAEALERTGFSFLPAFDALGFELGRGQVEALDQADAWDMGEGLRGFVSLGGARAGFDTTGGGIGFDVDTRNISAGVERAFGPAAFAGVMVGAVQGTADILNDRGSIEAEGVSVTAYGRATFGEGGALTAMIGYQDLEFDTTRRVMGAIAEGRADGHQMFGALEAEWMIRSGALTFGPTAGLEVYRLDVDGFDETGADAWNLSVADQSSDITLASIGLKGEFAVPDSATTLFGALRYTTAQGDDRSVTSGFVGLPAPDLAVDGFDQSWTEVSLGLSTRLGAPNTHLHAGYVGSFGADYDRHALQAAVRMDF